MESSNTQAPVSGAEFITLYEQQTTLSSQLEIASPSIRPLLEAGIAKADEQMEAIAADPEAQAYFISLGGPVIKAAQDLEAAAPALEAVGMTSEVEAMRTQLFKDIEDPKVKAAVHGLRLAGVIGESVPSSVAPLQSEPVVTHVAQHPAQAEAKEADQETTYVKVDKNNNLRIGGKTITLGSDRFGVNHDALQEDEVRSTQLQIIKFLSQNPGKAFIKKEIMDAVKGPGNWARAQWVVYDDFFYDEQRNSFKGQPLVQVTIENPKRHTFKIGPHNLAFEHVDVAFRSSDPSVFITTDGQTIRGQIGKILNIASKKPSGELLTEDDLQSHEDLAGRPLSGLASTVNSFLENANVGMRLEKVLTEEKRENSRRRKVAYRLQEVFARGQTDRQVGTEDRLPKPGPNEQSIPDESQDDARSKSESEKVNEYESPFTGDTLSDEEIAILLRQMNGALDENDEALLAAFDKNQQAVIAETALNKVIAKIDEDITAVVEMCTTAQELKLPVGTVVKAILDASANGEIDTLRAKLKA